MYFPTPEDADAAFAIFDQDSNGDATRDEIEMACLYVPFPPALFLGGEKCWC